MTRPWRYDAKEPWGTLQDALATFGRVHPTLEVREIEGCWLFQERGVDTDRGALSRVIPQFQVRNVRAVDALRQLVRNVVPGLPPVGGVAGSTLGQPGEPLPSLDDLAGQLVSLNVVGVTFTAVLREIGRASPGLVWMLTEVREQDSRTAGAFRLSAFLPHGAQQPIEGIIRQ